MYMGVFTIGQLVPCPPLGRQPKMQQIKNITHCRHRCRSQGGKTEEAKRDGSICP